MRKTRILKRLLVICAILASVFAIGSCGEKKPNSGNSSEIVVGGNSGTTAESKIVISGAVDIDLTKRAVSIDDWAKKVSATRGDEIFEVGVDSSAVQFGTKGVYSATYSCQNESVTISVTVYEEPTISLSDNQALQVRYSEFNDKILQDVSAIDCFGQEIDVFVYSYGGAKNADGSINEGEYTVKYAAADKSGQIVYVDRAVSVSADKAPTLVSAYTYDVENDGFVFSLSEEDYQSFLTLSIDGVAVPSEYLDKKDGKIVVDGDYLYSVCTVDRKYSMRVMTSKGYGDTEFTMTDVGTVAYDDSAIKSFVEKHYECFEPFEIPKVSLTNTRQSVTPIYRLYLDEDVAINDGVVTVLAEGVYTLEVTLRQGQVLEYSVKTFYNLGYLDGACYDSDTNLVELLRDGYTMKEITVSNISNNQIVLKYSEGDDEAELNRKLVALNKKYIYSMIVTAIDGESKELTQTTQFTVRDSATTDAVLSDENSLIGGKFAPKKTEFTSLESIDGEVFGVAGAYKWSTVDPSYSATKTVLGFGGEFQDKVNAGKYLTFSVYVQKNINLCAFFPSREIRLWLDMKYYTPEYYETLEENEKNTQLANYELYYKGVRFFDADGNRITTGGGFNSGAFKDKWITIEIEIPTGKDGATVHDVSSDYCGISVYNEANGSVYDGGDDKKATYIANVKLSTVQVMSDATLNESLGENGGDTTPDIGSGEFKKEEEIIKDVWDND